MKGVVRIEHVYHEDESGRLQKKVLNNLPSVEDSYSILKELVEGVKSKSGDDVILQYYYTSRDLRVKNTIMMIAFPKGDIINYDVNKNKFEGVEYGIYYENPIIINGKVVSQEDVQPFLELILLYDRYPYAPEKCKIRRLHCFYHQIKGEILPPEFWFMRPPQNLKS